MRKWCNHRVVEQLLLKSQGLLMEQSGQIRSFNNARTAARVSEVITGALEPTFRVECACSMPRETP